MKSREYLLRLQDPIQPEITTTIEYSGPVCDYAEAQRAVCEYWDRCWRRLSGTMTFTGTFM